MTEPHRRAAEAVAIIAFFASVLWLVLTASVFALIASIALVLVGVALGPPCNCQQCAVLQKLVDDHYGDDK